MSQHLSGFPREPSCDVVQDLLVPYLDGEATPEERLLVDSHRMSCPECARRLEAHREIGEALSAVCSRSTPGATEDPERDPTSGLADRARAVARSRRARLVRLARLATLAAAVLVAAGAVFLWKDFGADRTGVAPGVATGVDAADDAELIRSLDVLVALEEEGVDPTLEVVQRLLDEADDQWLRKELGEAFDPNEVPPLEDEL
jgi:anti-sigma factor RsiW